MTDDEVKREMEEEMVERYEEAGVPKGERMVHRVPRVEVEDIGVKESWRNKAEEERDMGDKPARADFDMMALAHYRAGVACPACQGHGRRSYGDTSTWRGGIGGQSITEGVCDKCWGSGRTDETGADQRRRGDWSKMIAELRAERAVADRLAEALTGCIKLLHEAGFVPGLTGENAVSDRVRAPVQAGEDALAAHAERRRG